jgi:hypothetical protein
VVSPCPNIDFKALLTKEQEEIRKAGGILIGYGVGKFTGLIPIEECPLIWKGDYT